MGVGTPLVIVILIFVIVIITTYVMIKEVCWS
jgi:hypothetical protein